MQRSLVTLLHKPQLGPVVLRPPARSALRQRRLVRVAAEAPAAEVGRAAAAETAMPGPLQERRAPRDAERPAYHVMARSGWINDPNGPLYYNGRYHLFYQHIVNSVNWSFGLVWGHAVSSDLVTWEHLEPALVPTPGSVDADGCFSGCAVIDADSKPIILYTGVRLRSNPDTGPLPTPELDLNLPFIETQCAAVPVEGDELLREWVKLEEPFLPHPPPNVPLAGWRDPFIFEVGGNGKEWGMLLGSGIKGKGGCAMIYRSKDLRSGWRFDGLLCESETDETGAMWECPILVELNRLPEQRLKYHGLHTWSSADNLAFAAAGHLDSNALLDGSPLPTTDTLLACPRSMLAYDEDDDYGAHQPPTATPSNGAVASGSGSGTEPRYTHLFTQSPDAPTNPVLYWLGSYDPHTSRFDIDNAKGPLRLDLGDLMYAPNLMTDGKGRHLMWGWLQERRRVGTYDYSGCLSLPRVLALRGETLVQEPAPEVVALRCGECWHATDLTVYPEEGTPLATVGGQRLEVEVTLARGESCASGLHLRCWRADSEDAALLVNWEMGTLEAVFTDNMPVDLATLPELDPQLDGLRRVGGPLDLRPGEPVTLRVFIDHSVVEVYASTGEVLSTRVYRGDPPSDDPGVSLVSYGGAAKVTSVTAWEMGSIWEDDHLQLSRRSEQVAAEKERLLHPVLSQEKALSKVSSLTEEGFASALTQLGVEAGGDWASL